MRAAESMQRKVFQETEVGGADKPRLVVMILINRSWMARDGPCAMRKTAN